MKVRRASGGNRCAPFILTRARVAWLSAFSLLAAANTGCDRDPACAGDPEKCTLPEACTDLAFTCDGGGASVRFITESEPLSGPSALGAPGDILLQNSRVRIVIDGLGNANHIAPTGGAILDMETRGDNNDMLNHIWVGTGPLPGESIAYTAVSIDDDGDAARVTLTGHLVGNTQHKAATVYTLHACEPGVRVRTEVKNGGTEAEVFGVQDGFWWGTKGSLPFVPSAGHKHPSFGLGNLNEVFRDSPFMVGSAHHDVGASYVSIGCETSTLEGFHSTQVSAFGAQRRVVAPGDYVSFARFIAAAKGPGVSPAADIAYQVRRMLFGEEHGEVKGRITAVTGLDVGQYSEAETSVWLYDGPRIVSIAPVAADGRFAAHVPHTQAGLFEVHRFGRRVRVGDFNLSDDEVALGNLPVVDSAQLHLSTVVNGAPGAAQVFLTPADAATRARTEAQFFRNGPLCAPLLGYAYGASPACNRVLVDGNATIRVPAGRYTVHATKGMLYTLAATDIDLVPGESTDVTLALRRVLGAGSGGTLTSFLSGDFHVHGQRSYDASIPDEARALSLLAAGVEVIAATDHDAIGDYSAALAAIGGTGRIVVMGGLEATPNVLFSLRDDLSYPQVIGHWNFWPLQQDVARPRKGAPWDEVAEPGALFQRVAEAGLPPHGIRQMNHPTSGNNFGRPQGWTFATGMRTDEPLLELASRTGAGIFFHQPDGAPFSNDAFDTIEVLNGTSGRENAAHISLWFHLLNHGVVKPGTASSDSHALIDSVVGSPRTLVFGENDVAAFDEVAFQNALKAGRSIMTNGPVFTAQYRTANRAPVLTDVTRLEPLDPGAEIVVDVHAAPYVNTDEVRLIHNGIVVDRRVISAAAENPLAQTTAPRGTVRFDIEAVVRFIDATEDAWFIVEVGPERLVLADLDCDSYPDTSDNDGDGVIDWRDVDRNGDSVITDDDVDRNGDGEITTQDAPAACSGGKGPVRTWCDSHQDAPFCIVTPGAHPLGMSQPFFVDVDGDGRFTPPGVSAPSFAPVD